MLKAVLLFLFSFGISWATEPNQIFVSQKGIVRTVDFYKLHPITIKAINYHPNFEKEGETEYKGYKVKDILRTFSPNKSITIIGKTGQFSVEISTNELIDNDNIIAFEKNGRSLIDDPNGLQIIYSQDAIKRYPHLKQRQYWCWWVRTLILDNDDNRILRGPRTRLKSEFPWPVPYGISTSKIQAQYEREGVLLNKPKKVNIFHLNGNAQTLDVENKNVFLTKAPTSKEGAHTLHIIDLKDGKIEKFHLNLYYLRSVEVKK